MHRPQVLVLLALALNPFNSMLAAGKPKTPAPETIRIGIVQSLFRDVPEALALALMQPFGALMKAQTGLDSDLIPGGDGLRLGKELAQDKVQLGVFQGIEFAWAQQKYPELRPLMIVVNQKPYRRAYLVVNADTKAAKWADLKGQSLSIPRFSHEHCYQFLDRHCRAQGVKTRGFFSKVTKPATAEAALDDVVDGVVAAAVVEEVPLECYQRRKPGRFHKLKILKQSEVFPASVIAYHNGRLDKATLRRFRDGMLNADKNPIGRQLLTLWSLTAFELIPADYLNNLHAIVKLYPPPAAKVKSAAKTGRSDKLERTDP